MSILLVVLLCAAWFGAGYHYGVYRATRPEDD